MATNYQRYETKNDGLIHSKRHPLYFDRGDEALYKVVDIRLIGYDWVLLWSYENDSDNDFSEKVTTTTTLRYKTAEEFAQHFKLSAEFSGTSFSAKAEGGIEHKTFTEEETTSTTTREREYGVKAHTSTFVYQKVYTFVVSVWFKHDCRGQLWTVGGPWDNGIAEVKSDVTINANEFKQTGVALRGRADLFPENVEGADTKSNVLLLKNCTWRCVMYLLERQVFDQVYVDSLKDSYNL